MANKRGPELENEYPEEVNSKRSKVDLTEVESDNSQYDEVDAIDDEEGDLQEEVDIANGEEEEPYGIQTN